MELGSSGFIAVIGNTMLAFNGWIRQDFHGTSNTYVLYAISATLTVPDAVPAVPGLSVWGVVVLGVGLLAGAVVVNSPTLSTRTTRRHA